MPLSDTDINAALQPTPTIDADAPAVVAWARERAGAGDDLAKARRLFLAVRDEVRYDPYAAIDLSPEGVRASRVLEKRVGFCVPKAILLAAACRACGIPARLGFADVRNHLSTARLREVMGTDVFAFHGFTEMHLGGRWVKATPTFNRELCEKFGVDPIAFDGEHDALFHRFDREGRRHMEYIREHGSFDDLPLERLVASWREAYPRFFSSTESDQGRRAATAGADFEAEAAEESAAAG